MGSHFMSEYGKGTNAKDVYDRLWQDARDEHGSDAYNGSLSTSSGCFEWDNLGPRSMVDAEAVAQAAADSDTPRLQKWESFAYVPVAATEDFDTKVKTHTFNLLGKEGPHVYADMLVRDACVEAAPAGWTYKSHHQTNTDQAFGTRRKPGPGSRVTRYVVSPHNQEFGSLDLAEQAAKAQIEKSLAHAEKYPSHGRPTDISITAVIRKEDKAPLVTYEMYRKKWKVTVDVTYIKAKGPLHTEGFLFFGWAAC